MAKKSPVRRDSGPPDASGVLAAAVRRLLRPLVRLLLSHGVQYPLLAELLKSIYLEVAYKEFRIEGRDQTQSRISLLTGIHRKDVKRLGDEVDDGASVPSTVSLGMRLAAQWLSDPDFLDFEGNPIPLERLSRKGGVRSFETLVSRVSKDIRSRAVLDEWLRLGVVVKTPDGRVQLKTEAFVPEQGFEEKVYFFGQNIHDHLATAVANLEGKTVPKLERAASYEGLSDDSAAELAALARQKGVRAVLEVNRRALALQQQDTARGGGKNRMSFGIYFYRGREEGDRTDET